MSAVPGAAQWRGSARVIVQGIAHLWKQRRQKLGAVDAASRNFDELGTAVGVGGLAETSAKGHSRLVDYLLQLAFGESYHKDKCV